jgi:hypothetical protein
MVPQPRSDPGAAAAAAAGQAGANWKCLAQQGFQWASMLLLLLLPLLTQQRVPHGQLLRAQAQPARAQPGGQGDKNDTTPLVMTM